MKNLFIIIILIILSNNAYAMRFVNYKALDGVTVTTTSNPIPSSYLTYFTAQLISTSTLAGTVKIQASNDASNNSNPGNFVDIPAASVTVIGGGNVMITPTACVYNWLRAVFTSSKIGRAHV